MKLYVIAISFLIAGNLSSQTFSNFILQNHQSKVTVNQNFLPLFDGELSMSIHKSPYLSFFLSFMFPGGGQFYNEEIGKGFAFLAGIGLSTALLFYFARESGNNEYDYVEPMIGDMFLIGGLWLWQLIDAPISSQRINKERNNQFELTPALNKSGYGASLKFYF